MARHDVTAEVIVGAVDSEVVGSPLDQTEKDRLVTDTQAAASSALTSAGYTEAAGSLVVSVEDPAAGPDSVLLWFNYNHNATAYRCVSPLAPGLNVLVGFNE